MFGKSQTLKLQHQFSERTGKTFRVHRASSFSRPKYSAWKKRDSNTYNYCQQLGHWKNECPALKSNAESPAGAKLNPAAIAAPTTSAVQLAVTPVCCLNSFGPTVSSVEGKVDYYAFISDGVVPLEGQKEVAVKISRH